jgi:hypothetical protein
MGLKFKFTLNKLNILNTLRLRSINQYIREKRRPAKVARATVNFMPLLESEEKATAFS